jgi:hypothetical protein
VPTISRTLLGRALTALAVGAAVALSACSDDDPETRKAIAPPPLVVDCVQRVDTNLEEWPPPGWEERSIEAGPVAFVGLRDAVDQKPEEGRVRFEVPVLVDAEKQVTVAARTPGVELGFGDQDENTEAVTFKACPSWERNFERPAEVGSFTQFVGTIESDEPACVEFDVHVLGESKPMRERFGLGRDCG